MRAIAYFISIRTIVPGAINTKYINIPVGFLISDIDHRRGLWWSTIGMHIYACMHACMRIHTCIVSYYYQAGMTACMHCMRARRSCSIEQRVLRYLGFLRMNCSSCFFFWFFWERAEKHFSDFSDISRSVKNSLDLDREELRVEES